MTRYARARTTADPNPTPVFDALVSELDEHDLPTGERALPVEPVRLPSLVPLELDGVQR